MPGRKAAYGLDIPLSGATVPNVLKRIELEISLAGRSFTQSFPAQANQTKHFEWDGLDVYGRPLQGSKQAQIRINYVYDGYYNLPPAVARSFGAASGQMIAGDIPTRQEIKLTQSQTVGIGLSGNQAASLGAWSLNAHHRYDPVAKILYLGDGSVRSPQDSAINTSVITSLAGTGVSGSSGDGGLAISANLNTPAGIAIGADSSIFVTEFSGNRIRRIKQDGTIATIAGTGVAGFSGDNGLATSANISNPAGITVGSDGSIYFLDSGNNRIRRISSDGVITTVAGNGVAGFSGDGGLAIQASIHLYGSYIGGGIAISADGNLLFTDINNYRIRRVDSAGNISTVAGSGVSGSGGDGQPAIAAKFNVGTGIALGNDGSVYVLEDSANRIRRIGSDGLINTFAGNGIAGFSGDGGLATQASMNFRASSFVAGQPFVKDGKLYIPDTGNQRIRVVGTDGVISTIAGMGSPGFSGDKGGALQAKLNVPMGENVLPDGSLVFTDLINHRIRRIAPALPGIGISDIAIPSEDGSQLYRFDSSGRHLETKDAITGNVLLSFSYDQSGQLIKITDIDNNITTIERDNLGNPTAIVSAFGQRTVLSLDSNGYLAAVTNPAGDQYQATYTATGLLTKFENPRHFASVMTYDALGKLINDTNAENGSQTLARSEIGNGYQVTHTTSNGRKTIYSVENLTGEERRQTTQPDGTVSIVNTKADGTTVSTAADGSVSSSVSGPDPRFGLLAPSSFVSKIDHG